MSNDELIQLTDDSNTGVADQDLISKAISAAQDTIDGYLRGRYPVPLASVPGIVKNIAADLAAYTCSSGAPSWQSMKAWN